MKVGLTRTISVGVALFCSLGVVMAGRQVGAPQQKEQMAEDVFKNIQVLRGISVNEFMETMGFFAASLNANCTYCHVAEANTDWGRYADDVEAKQTARRMVLMVGGINRTYFGGKRGVTCFTCHRASERPRITPSIAEQYGPPPPENPEAIQQAPDAPAVDQIFDKYIQALGGTKAVNNITSLVAEGSYQAYDDTEKRPVEIYAKAPGQRSVVMHSRSGDITWTFDGRSAWSAAPITDKPVPVIVLTGNDLEGFKVDAELSFPARIRQSLTQWVVGYPSSIDDRDVQVVQGTSSGGTIVRLYFENQSGLLVRIVRYTELPIGFVSTQTDYSDYREVSGVKMPFHWTVTWVDGRTNFELRQEQLNVPIDAAKFGRPAPPKPPVGQDSRG